MESLRDSINQLLKNKLKMEQSLPVKDPRLIKKQQEEIKEENIESNSQTEEILEKKQDFSPAENSIIKRHKTRYMASRIKYSPTSVKSRNFLSNISYTGINKSDFYNENFILDVYILIVKNLNPFSLQRKTYDKLKHEMVYMLWRECIPSEFYIYICQDTNFKYLNGRDVTTKTYTNTCISMCSLRYIQRPKNAESI